MATCVEGGGVAFFDFVVAWFVAHGLWVIVASNVGLMTSCMGGVRESHAGCDDMTCVCTRYVKKATLDATLDATI